MHCVYCNCLLTNDNTKSVEHIIPESLGNKEYVLASGLICDKCNNYFAREIEKPFLEKDIVKLLRGYEILPNKRNKFQNVSIMICGENTLLEYDKKSNAFYLGLSSNGIQKFINHPPRSVFTPKIDITTLKQSYTVSRFLCKVFTEYFLNALNRIYKRKGYILRAINNDNQLRAIFDFVRFGSQKQFYEYDILIDHKWLPFQRNDIIAKIDFIQIYDDASYFLLKWSCIEFRLFFKIGNNLNPANT